MGLKKKLDVSKGFWENLFHEIIWSYHTTPYSTTKETLFSIFYREVAMLPIEIETPLWRQSQFNEEVKEIGLKCIVDLINELSEACHARELASKHMAARKHNSKVKLGDMKEGDMVLK